jgi:hypothetical protein
VDRRRRPDRRPDPRWHLAFEVAVGQVVIIAAAIAAAILTRRHGVLTAS